MEIHLWNEDKNDLLKKERNISFEEIVFCIKHDGVIKIVEHPNKKKYENQKMYVIKYNDYIYLVPFIEEKEYIFLKTIIPSRKATKDFLGGKNHEK